MKARYRIRKKDPRTVLGGFPTRHPDGTPSEPYGLWDTLEHRWVNKWGEADEIYSTCCRDVAVMRRRDLNGWLGSSHPNA